MQDKSLEDIALKNRKEHTAVLKRQEQDLSDLFSNALQKGFDKVVSEQLQSKGKIKYIAISVLLSSIVSESYSLGINFYGEGFYLDENDVFSEFNIPYISNFVRENIAQTRKLLAYHRQPYKESDIVELQKAYVLSYILQVVELLKENIAPILSKMQIGKAECEDMVTVTFGAYMEPQMEIYTWEVER